MDTETQYIPEVDDYVIWTTDLGMKHEGWVYCKPKSEDNQARVKGGWRPVSNYITIETAVKEKPNCKYDKNNPHRYIHVLLLCYEHNWHQLKFIKRRNKKSPDHYAEFDDFHGNAT